MCVDKDFCLFNDQKGEQIHLRHKKSFMCSYKVFFMIVVADDQ